MVQVMHLMHLIMVARLSQGNWATICSSVPLLLHSGSCWGFCYTKSEEVGWAGEDIINQMVKKLPSKWLSLSELCPQDFTVHRLLPSGLHDLLPYPYILAWLMAFCALHFLPVLTSMPAKKTLVSVESLNRNTSLTSVTMNSPDRLLKGSRSFFLFLYKAMLLKLCGRPRHMCKK